MPSLLNIGLSGLNAAQAALNTASHNVANVNTPGFNRQRAILTTSVPIQTGAGSMGTGVSVATVQRVYSALLSEQASLARSNASESSIYAARAAQVADLLADGPGSLGEALAAFFGALSDLAARPGDLPTRQTVLASAQALAGGLRETAARLSDARATTNAEIARSVASINDYTEQIAQLNLRISVATGSGHPANDLLDQRDQAVRALSELVRVNTVVQSDGTLNVALASGQPLVVGAERYPLATVADPASPADLAIALRFGGADVLMRNEDFAGGEIGGLLRYRDGLLAGTQNQIGLLALSLAQAVNDQSRLGQDLTGSPGGAVFRAGAPGVTARTDNSGSAFIGATVIDASALQASDYDLRFDGASYTLTRLSDGTMTTFGSLPQTVDGMRLELQSGTIAAGDGFRVSPVRDGARDFAVLVSDPARLAAAAPVRALAGTANTGTGVAAQPAVATADPNLQQPVTLTFTGPGTFDVTGVGTGNPTGLAYTPEAPISFNGWTLSISGAPKAGDVFVVSANAGGSGDNRNALALAAIQDRLVAGGATPTGLLARLVGQVGSEARSAGLADQLQGRLYEQARAAEQSVGGVNLDEEAADLMRYQQAYQASAKVMVVAQTLLETILDLVR